MRIILLLFIFVGIHNSILASFYSLHRIEHNEKESYIEAVVDVDQLNDYITRVKKIWSYVLSNSELGGEDVVVLLTLYPNELPVRIQARTNNSRDFAPLDHLESSIQSVSIPMVDYSPINIWMLFSDAPKADSSIESMTKEGLYTSWQIHYHHFVNSSRKDQYDTLRHWSRLAALPTLSNIASAVDERFQGVVEVGERFKELITTTSWNTEKEIYRNGAFWKAKTEMAEGDKLIDTILILSYAANGELDKANRVLNISRLFKSGKRSTPADLILDHYMALSDYFYLEVNNDILKGLKEYHSKNYRTSEILFEELLEDFPTSVLAYHQNFIIQESLSSENFITDESYYDEILKRDPLFYSNVHDNSHTKTYESIKKKELIGIMSNKRMSLLHKLEEYAMICLEINEYGLSAFIYLNIYPYLSQDKESQYDLVLSRIFYCLYKLDADAVSALFQDGIKQPYEQIERMLIERRNDSNS